jgi:GDPmannose 4,6-dehydratase
MLPISIAFETIVNMVACVAWIIGDEQAKRDWGHAKDYVRMMWMMLQREEPDDFVVATNEAHSVRDFVNASFQHVGVEIEWEGEGVNEVGKDKATGIVRVSVNPKSVDHLRLALYHLPS